MLYQIKHSKGSFSEKCANLHFYFIYYPEDIHAKQPALENCPNFVHPICKYPLMENCPAW